MSENAKHTAGPYTPGPWRRNTREGRQVVEAIPEVGWLEVAKVVDINDARLIAAAPDMLAALKTLVDLYVANHWAVFDAARAAIAKAEGRE